MRFVFICATLRDLRETDDHSIGNTSHVKLELEHIALSFQLHGVDGQNRRVVVGFDELGATDPQFAMSRFYTVVLHSPTRVSGGRINEFVSERYGGRDVTHTAFVLQQ